VRFAKAEALGNDFILIEAQQLRGRAAPLARRLCDRHTGVGADGLLVVRRAGSKLALRVFNADGSEAELSGNGMRCAAAYAHRRGWVSGAELEIRTRAGAVPHRLRLGRGRLLGVTSWMPAARLPSRPAPPAVALERRRARPVLVDVGNPHLVLEVRRFDPPRLRRIGAWLARHPRFRAGVNVEFARRLDRHALAIWIWERGVGETRSSGSGAAAAYAALRSRGRVGASARVQMAGGTLMVRELPGALAVSGPARVVFLGSITSDRSGSDRR